LKRTHCGTWLALAACLATTPACGGRLESREVDPPGDDVQDGGRDAPVDVHVADVASNAPDASLLAPDAPPPAQDSGEATPDDAYCAAVARENATCCSECMNVCDVPKACAGAYAKASDAYRRAYTSCMDAYCFGYPAPCIVKGLSAATPTTAQLALVDTYCRACAPSESPAECQNATLGDRSVGTVAQSILALSDSVASQALECEQGWRPLNNECRIGFITCLAKYLPMIQLGGGC